MDLTNALRKARFAGRLIVPSSRLKILSAALLPAWAVATVSRADDYETYQHDIQRTGRSSSNLDPNSLQTSWSVSGFGSPLIVGNSVLGISSNSIDSFNIANGSVNRSTSSSGFPYAYGGGMIVQSYETVSNDNITVHLRVSNASTGTSIYTLAIPGDERPGINMAVDPLTGQQDAYICDGAGTVSAYRLGTASAAELWSISVPDGAQIGSQLGNYLLLASTDHYDAVNCSTGALTKIVNGGLDGGDNYLPVVDATRSQFYINSGNTLTAYKLSGSSFSKLWSKTEAGISSGGVALDAAGNIYSNDNSTLIELSPSNGSTVRSVAGTFSSGTTPIVTQNAIWDVEPNTFSEQYPSIEAYSLSTLQLITQYPQVSGVPDDVYEGDSALYDTHFVFGAGTNTEIDISTGTPVPEPSGLVMMLLPAFLLARRRIAL